MRTGRPSRRCRKTSALSTPVSRRCGIEVRKMAPCGAISVSSSVHVMTLLDNHHFVGAMMTPASVQAEVPMFAELGTRAHLMMMGTALDHDGLSAGNRRRRDSNRAKGGKNGSKLLHVVLLH